MAHQLATTPLLVAAIVSAMNNTTLNGGTVTAVAQPGNHGIVISQNFDSTGAWSKTWELQLR